MIRECMICLEDGTNFVVFACKHEVCALCFPKIIHAKPECPLCRANISPECARDFPDYHFADYLYPEQHVQIARDFNGRCCCLVSAVIGLLIYFVYLSYQKSN
jgi:hypothetical protein